MAETPNPYKTPDAPVDLHVEAPGPYALRVLLRMLIVLQIALIPIAIVLPDTLPTELKQLRDEREMVFLNTHGILAMVAIATLIVSLFGLWWEKRWAAWLFLVANVIGYVLQLATGVRIASDISGLIDSFSDAAIGATLVVLYLGGYFSPPAHKPPPDA